MHFVILIYRSARSARARAGSDDERDRSLIDEWVFELRGKGVRISSVSEARSSWHVYKTGLQVIVASASVLMDRTVAKHFVVDADSIDDVQAILESAPFLTAEVFAEVIATYGSSAAMVPSALARRIP